MICMASILFLLDHHSCLFLNLLASSLGSALPLGDPSTLHPTLPLPSIPRTRSWPLSLIVFQTSEA